ARQHAIRDAGTVQHVRRTDRALAHPARGIWRNRTQGRRRDQPWTVLCAGLSQSPGAGRRRSAGGGVWRGAERILSPATSAGCARAGAILKRRSMPAAVTTHTGFRQGFMGRNTALSRKDHQVISRNGDADLLAGGVVGMAGEDAFQLVAGGQLQAIERRSTEKGLADNQGLEIALRRVNDVVRAQQYIYRTAFRHDVGAIPMNDP